MDTAVVVVIGKIIPVIHPLTTTSGNLSWPKNVIRPEICWSTPITRRGYPSEAMGIRTDVRFRPAQGEKDELSDSHEDNHDVFANFGGPALG